MNAAPAKRRQAVVLLGPTGSGKTPLGDWLQSRSLWHRRCHHFDFGANLRETVAAGAGHGFSTAELQFLGSVLERGALLENDSFSIAEKILDRFLARRRVGEGDLLLMNGLPRHAGQAEALAGRLQCLAVLQLDCPAATVHLRIQHDTGGDRSRRVDDDPELIARKLQTFTARTAPLVAYYQEHGARIIRVPVAVETLPADLAALLERAPPPERLPRCKPGPGH